MIIYFVPERVVSGIERLKIFSTSAENFNVRRSLPCAGEAAQTPSYPKLWLEPLLPPSKDNILDFLQFHLFPNHIHRSSLKGSIKTFLQLALNDH